MKSWLTSSLRRVFPSTLPETRTTIALEAARGERFAFQVAYRTGSEPEELRLEAETNDGLTVRIRRVGFVPVHHLNIETSESELDAVGKIPGLVPDPLMPSESAHVGAFESGSFWVTVRADRDLEPGEYPIGLRLVTSDGSRIPLTATVRVRATRLPNRENFPVSHYFHADALSDYYGVEPFSEAYWQIMEPYLRNYGEHGMDGMLVPHITPPLDGVKRPIQLLGVQRTDDGFAFDFSQVLRWVRLAKAHGVTTFEWTHLFTQAGATHAARIYEGHGETENLVFPGDTVATSPEYKGFLAQLMPELRSVLAAEGVLEKSLFHVSDEPLLEHLDNYRVARNIVREVAPWATVIDSLSDIEFPAEGLVDVPVPLLWSANQFAEAGHNPWTYYCCVPRGDYLNRFLDTPLAKVRMGGWVLHANGAKGFVHWAYNYWYKSATRQLIDPFQVTDAGNWPIWGPGDGFVVYPGEDGPIDSIRWEVFADGLQDMALLQAAGEEVTKPALEPIKDYAVFPREPEWTHARRTELFDVLDQREL